MICFDIILEKPPGAVINSRSIIHLKATHLFLNLKTRINDFQEFLRLQPGVVYDLAIPTLLLACIGGGEVSDMGILSTETVDSSVLFLHALSLSPTAMEVALVLLSAASVHVSLSPPNPPVNNGECCFEKDGTNVLFEGFVHSITWCSKVSSLSAFAPTKLTMMFRS